MNKHFEGVGDERNNFATATACVHPFPPGTSTVGSVPGSRVRFSPSVGSRSTDKNVSALALPTTKTELFFKFVGDGEEAIVVSLTPTRTKIVTRRHSNNRSNFGAVRMALEKAEPCISRKAFVAVYCRLKIYSLCVCFTIDWKKDEYQDLVST